MHRRCAYASINTRSKVITHRRDAVLVRGVMYLIIAAVKCGVCIIIIIIVQCDDIVHCNTARQYSGAAARVINNH